jgi:hypothetical protein
MQPVAVGQIGDRQVPTRLRHLARDLGTAALGGMSPRGLPTRADPYPYVFRRHPSIAASANAGSAAPAPWTSSSGRADGEQGAPKP